MRTESAAAVVIAAALCGEGRAAPAGERLLERSSYLVTFTLPAQERNEPSPYRMPTTASANELAPVEVDAPQLEPLGFAGRGSSPRAGSNARQPDSDFLPISDRWRIGLPG